MAVPFYLNQHKIYVYHIVLESIRVWLGIIYIHVYSSQSVHFILIIQVSGI